MLNGCILFVCFSTCLAECLCDHSVLIVTRSATAKRMLLRIAEAPVRAPREKTDLSGPVPKSFIVPSSLNANLGRVARRMITTTT